MNKLNADGLYISAKNRKFYFGIIKNTNKNNWLCAHNLRNLLKKNKVVRIFFYQNF